MVQAAVGRAKKPVNAEKKRRAKFDENTFFRHLRADPEGASVRQLFREIDQRAALEIASYIIRYVRRWEEEPEVSARRKEGLE